MVFAIAFCQPSEDALGAVSTLAAVAVELVLSSLMLRAHPIITAPLGHIYPLMRAHNLGNLVIHEKIPWLATHHHHVLWLMNFQITVIAKVGRVVLAELGRLI